MTSGPEFERWLEDREKVRVIDFLRRRANGLSRAGTEMSRARAETVEILARDIEQGKHRP